MPTRARPAPLGIARGRVAARDAVGTNTHALSDAATIDTQIGPDITIGTRAHGSSGSGRNSSSRWRMRIGLPVACRLRPLHALLVTLSFLRSQLETLGVFVGLRTMEAGRGLLALASVGGGCLERLAALLTADRAHIRIDAFAAAKWFAGSTDKAEWFAAVKTRSWQCGMHVGQIEFFNVLKLLVAFHILVIVVLFVALVIVINITVVVNGDSVASLWLELVAQTPGHWFVVIPFAERFALPAVRRALAQTIPALTHWKHACASTAVIPIGFCRQTRCIDSRLTLGRRETADAVGRHRQSAASSGPVLRLNTRDGVKRGKKGSGLAVDSEASAPATTPAGAARSQPCRRNVIAARAK